MSLHNTLLITLTLLAAGAAGHLLLCRLTGGRRFVLYSLGAGLLPLTAAGIYQYAVSAFDPVLTYLTPTLWLFYLILFINVRNSLTLKMLALLAAAPGGVLSAAALEEAFGPEKSLAPRAEAMKANGFLKEEGGRLVPTPPARLLLAAVRLVRKILSIDRIG